jgi:hypothetical protein
MARIDGSRASWRDQGRKTDGERCLSEARARRVYGDIMPKSGTVGIKPVLVRSAALPADEGFLSSASMCPGK